MTPVLALLVFASACSRTQAVHTPAYRTIVSKLTALEEMLMDPMAFSATIANDQGTMSLKSQSHPAAMEQLPQTATGKGIKAFADKQEQRSVQAMKKQEPKSVRFGTVHFKGKGVGFQLPKEEPAAERFSLQGQRKCGTPKCNSEHCGSWAQKKLQALYDHWAITTADGMRRLGKGTTGLPGDRTERKKIENEIDSYKRLLETHRSQGMISKIGSTSCREKYTLVGNDYISCIRKHTAMLDFSFFGLSACETCICRDSRKAKLGYRSPTSSRDPIVKPGETAEPKELPPIQPAEHAEGQRLRG